MYKFLNTFFFLRQASLLLVVLTVGLLTWQRFGMDRVLVLNPQHGFTYVGQDDRSQGGASVASVTPAGKGVVLNCQLNGKYAWPFCQTSIYLAPTPDGVDLRNFDSITFDIAYTGPGRHAVRFYLRNFEPGLSKREDVGSLKVNEVEFDVPDSGVMTVPLNLFHVASWWVLDRKIPLMRTDVRVDNVSFVEVSTGSLAQTGSHRIEIKSIRFNGKWLSQTQLAMALVCAWFIFGVCLLVLMSKYFQRALQASRSRENHLRSINHALKLETRELAGQARTDPLTGALNREGLRDFLMTQWQNGIPTDTPLCIIFADLDHFKRINDRYGHLTGDLVLQDFAKLVLRQIRSHDRLVRWGGEEFLILCQNMCADQGKVLAEELREIVAQHAWPEGLHATCSFGVTMKIAGEDFGEMIARADRALYQAKAGGRNRVEAD